jgi:branched-chain amino acid transport system substrate-binding protein
MGLDMPFLGTDGWESDEFLQAGGKDVANTYFASHFSAEEKSERTVKFVADYEKLYGRAPIALGALGYDAVNFVADALRRAGGTEAIALRDALAATKDFPGVTGNITLDENRNPAKSAIVLRVADGKFTYLETVAP